jgi:hypothetical protein
MQSNNYALFQQISMISAGLHLLINVAMVVVMIVGWRRHRRTAFLVLLGWAIVACSTTATSWLWYPLMQKAGANLFGSNVDARLLMMVTNTAAYLLSSVLLGAGLAMLVFGRQPAQPSH